MSWDEYPIVGPLPSSTTGREVKNDAGWISAGYNGDGMPAAWLCARALSSVILSTEQNHTNQTWLDWFPGAWTVSEKRLSKEARNSFQLSTTTKRARPMI